MNFAYLSVYNNLVTVDAYCCPLLDGIGMALSVRHCLVNTDMLDPYTGLYMPKQRLSPAGVSLYSKG